MGAQQAGPGPGSPSELLRVSLIGTASAAMKSASSGLRAARVTASWKSRSPSLPRPAGINVGGHGIEYPVHRRDVVLGPARRGQAGQLCLEGLPGLQDGREPVPLRHQLHQAPGFYGHASVGCLHIRPGQQDITGLARWRRCALAAEVADLVLEFGGGTRGEHGDGIVRGVFNRAHVRRRAQRPFREVKRTFDPDGLLNPGKIVERPASARTCALAPDPHTWEPMTHLTSLRGRAGGAADQCNGHGAPAASTRGGMCPSYMATGGGALDPRPRQAC